MKTIPLKNIFCLCLVIAMLLLSTDVDAQRRKRKRKNKDVEPDKQGLSYNYGLLIGSSMKMQGMPVDSINTKELLAGLEMALQSDLDASALDSAQQLFNRRIAAIRESLSAKALVEEKKWFEENAKANPEIKTTATGVQYEVLQAGEGPKPNLSDRVTTHYHGTLTDGTVFDSSVERGKPSSFPIQGVIKGWQDILQLMPLGSKWKVYIPSELAYGSQAVGNIPANAILIFEIELLEIE